MRLTAHDYRLGVGFDDFNYDKIAYSMTPSDTTTIYEAGKKLLSYTAPSKQDIHPIMHQVYGVSEYAYQFMQASNPLLLDELIKRELGICMTRDMFANVAQEMMPMDIVESIKEIPSIMFSAAYFHHTKGSVVSFDESAITECGYLDFSDKVTTEYVVLPSKNIYLSFDELNLENTVQRQKLLGCYVSELNVNNLTISERELVHLGFEPPVTENFTYPDLRVLEFGLIGANNGFTFIFLPINQSKPISETIESIASNRRFDYLPPALRQEVIDNLKLIMNCLAYFSCADFRKKEVAPFQINVKAALSNRATKMNLTKNRKKLFNTITVSSSSSIFKTKDKTIRSGVAPHVRRGHIRMQPYGKRGDNLRKPLYIAPTLVNQNTKDDTETRQKVYKVK